ncbi:hypothetical protein C4572_01040 [Candidatus Parcubacteria bacterium]|nr:MAG: hypothetical protein C4572_01040 [Candidatus Parcubacteria bacterium]
MKVVILAAGEGRRMRPITLERPKPLIKINNKPILSHILESLPKEVEEVVLVVRYLAEKIKNFFGREFMDRKISYAAGSPLGTAHSFLAASKSIGREERFLALYGDELVLKEDIENCLKERFSVIVFKSEKPWAGGVAKIDQSGYLINIEEKPENPSSDMVAGGIMVIDGGIFECEAARGAKGEYYLSALLAQFAKKKKVKAVISEEFLGDITTPEDIKRIELKMKLRELRKEEA